MQRTKPYPKRKVEAYKRVQELAKKYPVIVLANMHKVRTMQINELRKRFRNEMTIYVVKNKIAALALKELNLPGVQDFINFLKGQNMFIFTYMDPFKLYILLEKNKVNLPAKGGDIATDDVVIPAGNTGLPPGPILSEFKEAKVPTKIESGSIWVVRDTVVAKRGEVISSKLASLLSKLGIKPIRAGISINAVLWNGRVLTSEDVKVDVEAVKSAIETYAQDAIKLANYIKYPTKELLPTYIQEAVSKALSLATRIEYPTKETMPLILQKYHSIAEAILSKIKEKGYGG